MSKHCETCTCNKRAPVQASKEHNKGSGHIAWSEHLEAWSVYAAKYGRQQSPERIAERWGFSYGELVMFLGHPPKTWMPGEIS